MKYDGGVAFPIDDLYTGLSKRDWFAGQALAGLMPYYMSQDAFDPEEVAATAYDIADAMIAERSL